MRLTEMDPLDRMNEINEIEPLIGLSFGWIHRRMKPIGFGLNHRLDEINQLIGRNQLDRMNGINEIEPLIGLLFGWIHRQMKPIE